MKIAMSIVLLALLSAGASAGDLARIVSVPEICEGQGEERGATLRFAVSDYRDVTVRVLDSNSNVVRHLAGGVLGPNPPLPFAPDSLSQDLPFDYKDDRGRTLPKGEYTFCVDVGLNPRFGAVLGASPYSHAFVGGVAVDREGNVYVVRDSACWPHELSVRVFDREGRYVRQMAPPHPKDLSRFKDRPGNFGPGSGPGSFLVLGSGGDLVPHMEPTKAQIYTDEAFECNQVVPDPKGNFIFNVNEHVERASGWLGHQRKLEKEAGNRTHHRLMKLDRFGLPVYDFRIGFRHPALPESLTLGWNRVPFLDELHGWRYYYCCDRDGNIYISDAGRRETEEGLSGQETADQNCPHVVWKLGPDLEPRSEFTYCGTRPCEARSYLGTKGEPGDGPDRFNGPKGLAVDAEGRIYVADAGNNCIKIFRKDGFFLKDIRGARYRGEDKPLRNPTALGLHPKDGSIYAIVEIENGRRLVKLKSGADRAAAWTCDLSYSAFYNLAVDAGTAPTIVWVAQGGGIGTFTRIVDKGDSLGDVKHFGGCVEGAFVEPFAVAATDGGDLFVEDALHGLVKMSARDGSGWKVLVKRADVGRTPSGGWAVPASLRLKQAQDAKQAELPSPRPAVIAADPGGRVYRYSCGEITRYDREGNVVPFGGGNAIKTRYTQNPHLNQHGLAIDAKGNLYVVVSETAGTPEKQRQLDELDVYSPDGALKEKNIVPERSGIRTVAVDAGGALYVTRTRDGMWLLKLGAGSGRGDLRWQAGCVSLCSAGCKCLYTLLAVSKSGFIYAINIAQYHITILDVNGNVVTRFGRYGNFDCPEAPGRPAVPGIPLLCPLAVAVTEDAVFVSDRLNQRVVRCELEYDDSREVKLEVSGKEMTQGRLQEGADIRKGAVESVAVNCGASEETRDAQGRVWIPDRQFQEGDWGILGKTPGGCAVRSPDLEIKNTDKPWLYRTERYAVEGYKFTVKPGKYTVRLHFAETSRAITEPGQRVFTVAICGTAVLVNFDILKESGGKCTAIMKEFKGISPERGEVVTIAFMRLRGDVAINGIEIERE